MAASSTVPKHDDSGKSGLAKLVSSPLPALESMCGCSAATSKSRTALALAPQDQARPRRARPEALVVVGSDGFVSLAALRWLADQDAAFVMLERNGKTLCVTGPVGSSDAKLRRAQALPSATGWGLKSAAD